MMKWSKKSPDKTGFYWAKVEDNKPTIIEVDAGKTWECYMFGQDYWLTKDQVKDFLWGDAIIFEGDE